MTNGELFKKENPDIEVKINGSCVWIYYFDGVNHYTIPTEWWNKEIGLLDKIRAEIEFERNQFIAASGMYQALNMALNVIDRHMKEGD